MEGGREGAYFSPQINANGSCIIKILAILSWALAGKGVAPSGGRKPGSLNGKWPEPPRESRQGNRVFLFDRVPISWIFRKNAGAFSRGNSGFGKQESGLCPIFKAILQMVINMSGLLEYKI